LGRFDKLEFDGGTGPPVPAGKEVAGPDIAFLQAEREYREGNFDNALRFYSRALEADKLMVEAWRRQVDMLLELGEFNEAAIWADKAMELFPEDPDLLAVKAISLCRKGDAGNAMKIADKAIHLPGSSPLPWVARGELLLVRREGHFEYCFSKAVCLAPGGWLTLARIARVYEFYGLYSKALEYFNRAMAAEPGVPFILMQIAVCQKELGLNANAVKTLDQVIRINPRNVEARKLQAAIAGSRPNLGFKGFFRRLMGR